MQIIDVERIIMIRSSTIGSWLEIHSQDCRTLDLRFSRSRERLMTRNQLHLQLRHVPETQMTS